MSEEVIGGNSAQQLKSIIERCERIQQDIDDVKADQKEIFAEAKGNGFDTKIIKKILRLRKMDAAARQEEEALLQTYLDALGDPL